jgi:hypothetical protein
MPFKSGNLLLINITKKREKDIARASVQFLRLFIFNIDKHSIKLARAYMLIYFVVNLIL